MKDKEKKNAAEQKRNDDKEDSLKALEVKCKLSHAEADTNDTETYTSLE